MVLQGVGPDPPLKPDPPRYSASRSPAGRVRSAYVAGRLRLLVIDVTPVTHAAGGAPGSETTWLIRASWLIRGSMFPRIHLIARINHANWAALTGWDDSGRRWLGHRWLRKRTRQVAPGQAARGGAGPPGQPRLGGEGRRARRYVSERGASSLPVKPLDASITGFAPAFLVQLARSDTASVASRRTLSDRRDSTVVSAGRG